MDLVVRRRLRLAALTVFVVAGPLLLAYAFGYWPRVLSVREWLASPQPTVGALVIRTSPRDARVSVDGVAADGRTPRGLGSVPAGSHVIRIEKPGYRPYEKRLDIVGGQVTDMLHVQLLPETPEEAVVRASVEDARFSPDGRSVLVRTGATFSLLGLSDALNDVGVSFQLPAGVNDLPGVFWAPRSPVIALGTEQSPGVFRGVALVDLRTAEVRRIQGDQDVIGWTKTGPELLVLRSQDGDLLGLPPSWGSVRSGVRDREEHLASAVTNAAIHPRGILVEQRHPSTGAQLVLLTGDGGREHVAPRPKTLFSRLAVSSRGIIAGVSAEDLELHVFEPETPEWQILARGVRELAWSPDGEKLLYQESEFDAWVVNVAEERSVLPRGVPVLVNRISHPMRNLRWFPRSQHFLFQEQDIVRVAEIDPRGGHRIETLVSSNSGDSKPVTSEDGSVVYLTARRRNPLGQETTESVLLRVSLRTADDR